MPDSVEIESFFQRVCAAIDAGDTDFWDAALDDDVLAVGSAPGEVYRGRAELLRGLAEYGAIPCAAQGVVGRVHGDAAWCFGDVTVAGVEARLTLVLAGGAGGWRITHWHLSLGVPDEDALPGAGR